MRLTSDEDFKVLKIRRMKFANQLEQGIFLRRYKRFFADVEWQGQTIITHVPNTGSMRGCNIEGSLCRFSVSDDPKRKLKYTLEMVQAPSGAWVGVNTATPNKIVREALDARLFSHWSAIASVKNEHKISDETRFDFLLEMGEGRKHFVEVKNVSLVEDGVAMFPDASTERGRKHLRELTRLVGEGHSAELVFTVGRDDAKSFRAADRIDPEYGELLREASRAGVRITPVVIDLSDREISLSKKLLKFES